MKNKLVLSYLAGAMDSDGHFSLKRLTYAMRIRGDATQPTYSEILGLKQVTPEIPRLLRETFGGTLYLEKPSTKNGRPLWSWSITALAASKACRALLPFILVKRRQVETLLELRASHEGKYKSIAYWFVTENPKWRKLPMMTMREAAAALGYTNSTSVYQALNIGVLVSLPWRRGQGERARIPVALVERIRAVALKDGKNRTKNSGHIRPPLLIAWRERLWDRVRLLNKIGTAEHPITMRTGPYKPK